jgi:hypothetical protein
MKLCKGCQQKRQYTDFAKSGWGKCRACRTNRERELRHDRADNK